MSRWWWGREICRAVWTYIRTKTCFGSRIGMSLRPAPNLRSNRFVFPPLCHWNMPSLRLLARLFTFETCNLLIKNLLLGKSFFSLLTPWLAGCWCLCSTRGHIRGREQWTVVIIEYVHAVISWSGTPAASWNVGGGLAACWSFARGDLLWFLSTASLKCPV